MSGLWAKRNLPRVAAQVGHVEPGAVGTDREELRDCADDGSNPLQKAPQISPIFKADRSRSMFRARKTFDGLHVAACSLFDVRPCDLAQLLQVYAFAHIGKFEPQSFAIDLIALLTAGVSGYVAMAHFGWSTRWFHVKCPSRSLVTSGVATRKTAIAQDCGSLRDPLQRSIREALGFMGAGPLARRACPLMGNPVGNLVHAGSRQSRPHHHDRRVRKRSFQAKSIPHATGRLHGRCSQ
jgi:hypothetical protein